MRTKQAFYNLLTSLLLQFIVAIAGFILPPIRIKTYGSSMNGLVGSIGQFIAYLQLVEAGLNTASVQALYKPLAQKDHKQTDAILSASNKFYIQSGSIFAVLVALLSVVYPWITRDEVSPLLSFLLVAVISISGLTEFFIGAKYRILLTADQKGYVLNTSLIIGNLINTVLSILIMTSGLNIIVLQLTTGIIYLIRVIGIVMYVRRKYLNLQFNSTPDYKAINKRWDAFIHQLAGVVIFNTPVVITTIFLGLTEVSIYMIYSVVFGSLGTLISSFSRSMTPAFGEVIALGDREKLLKVYSNFEGFYYAIIAFIFTVTSIMIIPFISLYTRGIEDANYIDPVLAVLFAVIGLLHHIRIPQSIVISASGHFKETKGRAIYEAIIHVAASLIFVQFLGLHGVLLGSLCSYGYRAIDMLLYGNLRVLQQSPWITIKRLLINAAAGILIVIIALNALAISPQGWGSWILNSFGVAIFTFLIIAAVNYLFDKEAVLDVYKRGNILVSSLLRKSVVVRKQAGG